MVRQRILTSSQSDQLSMYSRSRRTQSRKSRTLFRPLTCQRQGRPGLTLRGRRAEEAHLAAEEVDELGKFVDGRLAQPAADGGDARVVGDFEDGSTHFIE